MSTPNDSAILDSILGKLYDVPRFENDMVVVESAGHHIRVGIKRNGIAFSWWEPTHPFTVPKIHLPQQNGWDFRVEAPGENIVMATLSNVEITHILTLICRNPELKPKPIEVQWISRRNLHPVQQAAA